MSKTPTSYTHGSDFGTPDLDGAKLHLFAVEALQKNQMSVFAALDDFREALLAEGGVCAALVGWGEEESDRLMSAYLRTTLGQQRNEERPQTKSLRPQPSLSAPTRSNVETPPTSAELSRSLRNKVKTYGAIFNETMVDGRPIHTFSYGEARSLIPVKERRVDSLKGQVEQESFELNLLRLITSHAVPDDATTSVAEIMTEKQLKSYLKKAEKVEVA